MPTSNYAAFDVLIDLGTGTYTLVPLATVKVYDIQAADPVTGVGAIALPDITSDADGHVAPGTLAISAGRKVRFSWNRTTDGRCGSATAVTS
jgi:hypothetical protein